MCACSTILDEEFLASLPVSRTSVACNGSCWVLWSSAGCSFTLSSDGVCIRAVRSSGFQPCSPTWCFSFFWEERWHWTAATTACCTTSRRDGTNCYRLARGSTAPRKFSSPTVSAPGLCLLSDRTTSSTTIVTSKRRHSLSYGNLFLTDSAIVSATNGQFRIFLARSRELNSSSLNRYFRIERFATKGNTF